MSRRIRGLALGLTIGLAGTLAIALAPWVHIEETLGLDWLFNLRGPVSPPGNVVIVAIDEQSTQKLGLPDKPRDWPRDLHAQLVRYLASAGARVISFDLTFDTPSTDAASDQQLAAAIGHAGNVLVTESIRQETIHLHGPTGQPLGNVVVEKPVPPIPVVERAVLGHAPFLLPKSPRVNTYWTFRSGAGDAPTFPVLAFHAYALDAYDEFLALVRKAEPSVSLPPTASAARPFDSETGPGAVLALRDALQGDPRIRERMLQQLRATPDLESTRERQRLIRSFVALYSSSETSYLNFYGPPRSIETLSYHRVLEAARSIGSPDTSWLDANAFKNKAVFVGLSAATQAGQDRLHDDYRTVYSLSSGLDVSGVEIAATAFANLVEDRPLRALAPIAQLAIVGVWGVALGILFRSLRPMPALAVVGVLAGVYLWVVYDRFAAAALWMPSVIPIGIQVPLAAFVAAWLSYRDARLDRERVKEAVGYYLPSTVVDRIARDVGTVTSSNRVVFGACLATDAEKYTTLAETMEPGALGALMNEYYAELFPPVERSGGTVVDVVGDAMVAVWAAALSDAALRTSACGAALEIIERLDRFNHSANGRPALPTRLGLHSGQMLIGSVGAAHHYEYRAVGDIVNSASRIQGLNKTLGTRVLASDAIVDGLDLFTTRPLGSFLLAGKMNAVSLVELLGRKQDASPQMSNICGLFARALNDYCAGRWREAAQQFAEILRMAPDDGPSRFFQSRCERLLLSPPSDLWSPSVRIDAK